MRERFLYSFYRAVSLEMNVGTSGIEAGKMDGWEHAYFVVGVLHVMRALR